MLVTSERDKLRLMYVTAWQKMLSHQALTPLEKNITEVIAMHPNFQKIVENYQAIDQEFGETSDENPFLHLGLHLGLRDQIVTNRPAGIQTVYQKLCGIIDQHEAEHQMMQVLADMLWHAQQTQSIPDEKAYLAALKEIVENI